MISFTNAKLIKALILALLAVTVLGDIVVRPEPSKFTDLARTVCRGKRAGKPMKRVQDVIACEDACLALPECEAFNFRKNKCVFIKKIKQVRKNKKMTCYQRIEGIVN